MTPEELTAAQGKLAEVDTELAALDQTIRDCITRAQEFNNARRLAHGQRTELSKAVEQLRQSVAAQLVENKKTLTEKIRQEAAAKAAEEAAKPKEPTQLDVLQAKVEELTELLKQKNG